MSPASRLFLAGITLYRRVVSPLFGRHCRYHPTCSEYAQIAVTRFGAWGGLKLAARRVLRCHPWSPGGVDHVPQRKVA